MQGLLQFLIKNSNALLFLLLEGISFYLIVRFNDEQQRVYLSTASAFVGSVNKTADNVTNYFGLKDQVNELMKENALLRQELYKMEVLRGDSLLGDSISREQLPAFLKDSIPASAVRDSYTFIPANVISNSIISEDNTLTLNRGSLDGVASDMGVMSSNGLVGIVLKVSKHFAVVMSILHRQTRISASIRRTGYFGTLVWHGGDSKYMYLEAVPRHEQIAKGDTIQTSGYSNVFPAGILIGVVDDFYTKPGDNYFTIRVELSNRLGKLQHAYVVKNNQRKEFLEVEQQQSQK